MDKKQCLYHAFKIASQLLLALCVGLLITALYRSGLVADDPGILLNESLWNGAFLWAGLVASFLLLLTIHELYANGFLRRSFYGARKTAFVLLHLLCLLILAFGVYAATDTHLKLNDIVNSRPKSHAQGEIYLPVLQIPLEKLESLLGSGQSEIIYVARYDCPTCQDVGPELEAFLKDNRLSALYYDTTNDREMRLDYLKEVLAQYGITFVPAMVILENGTVAFLFEGEQIVEDLENYLAGKYGGLPFSFINNKS